MLLALATVGGALLARLGVARAFGVLARPGPRRALDLLLELAPLLWTALALMALNAAVHDFTGIEARPGARWTAASGACLLLVPAAALGGRARAWAGAALVAAAALLALADLVYLHYFGSIVPVVALTASHHLGEVGDSALAELDGAWLWLVVAPIATLIAAGLWPAAGRLPPVAPVSSVAPVAPAASIATEAATVDETAPDRRPSAPSPARPPRRRARWIAAASLLALALPASWRLGGALTGDLGQRVFSEQEIIARFGYLNAHLFDLARFLRERGRRRPLAAEAQAKVETFHRERAEAAAARSAASALPPATAAGANLLLIQVEAAQGWVIGLEVDGREVTPRLNALRETADWYPYFIDQTNQGKTSDAEYAVLNSQHPLGQGALCFLRADNRFWTLAHVLGEQGYASLSAHPYARGFWNRATLHPRYGFERSLFRRELGEGPTTGWGLADGPFLERMLPRLRELPEPWFALLITLSLHHPYDDFPAELDTLELGPLEGTRVGHYLEAMHYFDRALDELLTGLEQAGLLERTVVAIYGDHDARFDLERYPEVRTLAGAVDWDPALFHRLERVPAFVLRPEASRRVAPGGTVEVVGGHVDLAPTLLHHLGVERPESFIGQPLVPGPNAGFAAYPDGSAYGRGPRLDPRLEHDPDRERDPAAGSAPAPLRMFVASGRDIPREGGCFEFPAGASLPVAACSELAERAREELTISRTVLDHDLHRTLAD